MALAALLVIGVSESAKFNNFIVAIKTSVIVAFIIIGGWFVIEHFDTLKANWDPFIPAATGEKGDLTSVAMSRVSKKHPAAWGRYVNRNRA